MAKKKSTKTKKRRTRRTDIVSRSKKDPSLAKMWGMGMKK